MTVRVQAFAGDAVAAAGNRKRWPQIGVLTKIRCVQVGVAKFIIACRRTFKMQINTLEGHGRSRAVDAAAHDRRVWIVAHCPAKQAKPVLGNQSIVIQKYYPVGSPRLFRAQQPVTGGRSADIHGQGNNAQIHIRAFMPAFKDFGGIVCAAIV